MNKNTLSLLKKRLVKELEDFNSLINKLKKGVLAYSDLQKYLGSELFELIKYELSDQGMLKEEISAAPPRPTSSLLDPALIAKARGLVNNVIVKAMAQFFKSNH